MSDQAIPELYFLTTSDLHRLSGNRSLSSCRNDHKFFRDLFGVKKGVPGIPLHKYAEYVDVPADMILKELGVKLKRGRDTQGWRG